MDLDEVQVNLGVCPHCATPVHFRKTKEELRRLLELRRSSASRPVESKKKYKRKPKHPKQEEF